jgi:hypothetical protein
MVNVTVTATISSFQELHGNLLPVVHVREHVGTALVPSTPHQSERT